MDNLPELLGLSYFSASPPVLPRKEYPEGAIAWICLMVLRDPCVTQLSAWLMNGIELSFQRTKSSSPICPHKDGSEPRARMRMCLLSGNGTLSGSGLTLKEELRHWSSEPGYQSCAETC